MGKNLSISIQEETLSLNTGALAQLMKKDDEEEKGLSIAIKILIVLVILCFLAGLFLFIKSFIIE